MKAPLLMTTSLLLAGCHSQPAAVTNGSQYTCPDGMRVWAGLNEDQRVMRLTLRGRTYTLHRSDGGNSYSNAKLTARRDDLFLHLNIAGTLLPQHCRLAIEEKTTPASPPTPALDNGTPLR